MLTYVIMGFLCLVVVCIAALLLSVVYKLIRRILHNE